MKLRENLGKFKFYFLPYEMAKTAYLELRYKTVQRLQGKPLDPEMYGSWTWNNGYELGRTGVPGVRTLPIPEFEYELDHGMTD